LIFTVNMSGSRARQIARPVPVVLFKTPTEPLASDSYQLRLTEAGYSPIFVNVLAERWLTEKLVGILLEGNGRHRGELERKQEWEGVVITSRRGAEGWVQAARKAASWSEKGSSRKPMTL
jgi:uroporphyrinogen-III synthase